MDYLHEFLGILPVLLSLIVIEGLLSMDNALVVAALASHLPREQRAFALRVGILGAYVFRGLAMFLVTLIIANPWLRILGATYLLSLMAAKLAEFGGKEDAGGTDRTQKRSLFLTVLRIEVVDLTLSLDNVVVAVALDRRIWVVCTGAFIGILALRFLAGFGVRLIETFPILEPTAFLLVGFVGVLLGVEAGTELVSGEGQGVRLTASGKFVGLVTILALSLLYDRTATGRAILRPVVAAGRPVIVVLDKFFGALGWPAAKCIHWGRCLLRREPAQPRS